MDLNIGLAFFGGLASFFSPCVISMMPIYIGYIGGRSFNPENQGNKKAFRGIVFLHGLIFIAGFSLVFITFGMTISIFGGYLVMFRWWLIRLAGMIIIVFGVHLSGLVKIKWLEYEMKFQTSFENKNNLATSFIIGVIFAAGWTPCIGPILGSILALTIQSGTIYNGFYYLIAYSIGMGIPFLISCVSLEWVSTFIRKHMRVSLMIEKGMGVILVGMGLMMVFGFYDLIVQSFANFRMG